MESPATQDGATVPHAQKNYRVEHSTFKQEMSTYTSIKVKDVTKSKPDVLQSKFTINTGKKVSRQNLLDNISDYALLHEDELVTSSPLQVAGLPDS